MKTCLHCTFMKISDRENKEAEQFKEDRLPCLATPKINVALEFAALANNEKKICQGET